VARARSRNGAGCRKGAAVARQRAGLAHAVFRERYEFLSSFARKMPRDFGPAILWCWVVARVNVCDCKDFQPVRKILRCLAQDVLPCLLPTPEIKEGTSQ
jgi:hypothetical protein